MINSDDSPDRADGNAGPGNGLSPFPETTLAVESAHLIGTIDTTDTRARWPEWCLHDSRNAAVLVVPAEPINPTMWVVLMASIVLILAIPRTPGN